MSCTVQAAQEEWFPALGDITVIGLLGSGKEMARRAAKQVMRGMHCFISSNLAIIFDLVKKSVFVLFSPLLRAYSALYSIERVIS